MPGVTEAMAFTDSYKNMECLGGMRLQDFFLGLPVQRRVPQLVYIYIANVTCITNKDFFFKKC